MHFLICFSKKKKQSTKMPCTSCMREYSRSRKEVSCPSCRFGYCEKCLNNVCTIPSISQLPISICAACHNLLIKKDIIQKEKTRPIWDNGEEVPPSLRSLYPRQQKNNGKMLNESKRNNKWDELEARLQRLNEPIDVDNGSIVGTSERRNIGTNRMEELEERLAALKGVPLDLIKKPRLLVTNDEDDEEGGSNPMLDDEAQKLLRQAEDSFKIGKSQNYLIPKEEDGNGSNSSIATQNYSADSVQIRKTINEVTTAKSSSSDLSRAASELIYPNFAECIEKTLEDATMAEREAIEFIKKHKDENGKQQSTETANNESTSSKAENSLTENGQNKQTKIGKFKKFFL